MGSCKQEDIYTLPSGELQGRLLYYTNNNMGIPGVKIEVEGSSPNLYTYSDAYGKYDIKNLPGGTYNLIFSKDSFPTFKIIGFIMLGGNVPFVLYPLEASKLSYNQLSSMTVDSSQMNFYPYYRVLSKCNTTSYSLFRYYVSDKPDVSWNNYLLTGLFSSNSAGSYFYIESDRELTQLAAKTKMYIIAYPASDNNFYTNYIDTESGLTIYPVNQALPSSKVTFILP